MRSFEALVELFRQNELRITPQRQVIFERDFEGLTLSAEETSGYQVLRRQVTFYGICPDCQAK